MFVRKCWGGPPAVRRAGEVGPYRVAVVGAALLLQPPGFGQRSNVIETTRAPARTNSRTVAAPMPREPPVTRATFPSRDNVGW